MLIRRRPTDPYPVEEDTDQSIPPTTEWRPGAPAGIPGLVPYVRCSGWEEHPSWAGRYDFATREAPRHAHLFRTNTVTYYAPCREPTTTLWDKLIGTTWHKECFERRLQGPLFITQVHWQEQGKVQSLSRQQLLDGLHSLMRRVEGCDTVGLSMLLKYARWRTIHRPYDPYPRLYFEATAAYYHINCILSPKVYDTAAGYGRFLDYLSDCELAGEMPPRWTHHPYPVTVHALQTSLVLGPGRVRPGQPVSDYAFQVARLLQTTNLGLVPEDATRLAKAKQINAALNEKWFGEGTPEGEGNFKENYAAIENVCAEERERGDWESLAPTLVEPYQ